MQSWGANSRFVVRDTAAEPTKSGVVGVLAAALGIRRDDDEKIAELARLRLGVRVDREGIVEHDYHTVGNVPNTAGKKPQTAVTHRYYLADALFLVGIEGKRSVLAPLQDAIRRPHWPIFFGRKAFMPTRPLIANEAGNGVLTGQGIVDQPLEDALWAHPWLEDRKNARRQEQAKINQNKSVDVRMVLDCPPSHPEAELRHDYPVSFARTNRKHRSRTVLITYTPLTQEMLTAGESACS